MPSNLYAGCAVANITPATGVHMGGYWGRGSGAIGIHDALMAKALVWNQEGELSALLSLDLVGVSSDWVQDLRQRVAGHMPIAAERLMICCSHTHAGPLTMPFRGMGEMDVEYLTRTSATCEKIINQAFEVQQPTQIGYAKVPVQLGINRRKARRGEVVMGQNGIETVVPYAHIVSLMGSKGLVATLFSHACHPVVLGSSNHFISGDFAGVAATWIEAESGGPALFINGACGDINPRITNGNFTHVNALGRELGIAVVAGLESVEEVTGIYKGHRANIDLPLIEPPSQWYLRAEKMLLQVKREVKKIIHSGGDVGAGKILEAQLEWIKTLIAKIHNGCIAESQPFEIQLLTLGGIRLIGMEGEMFSRYQLDIEAAHDKVILCGYANGCVGYIPTADEYTHGGYEIDAAYKVFPSVQMVAPTSEELIRANVDTMLNEQKRNVC